MSNLLLLFPDTKIKPDIYEIPIETNNEIIDSLFIRMRDDKTVTNRLIKVWNKPQIEPYMFGCTHDKTWSLDKYEMEKHGCWNKPFPLPSKNNY